MARTVPESGDFLVMVCALRWGFGGGHDWKEGLYGYGVLYEIQYFRPRDRDRECIAYSCS